LSRGDKIVPRGLSLCPRGQRDSRGDKSGTKRQLGDKSGTNGTIGTILSPQEGTISRAENREIYTVIFSTIERKLSPRGQYNCLWGQNCPTGTVSLSPGTKRQLGTNRGQRDKSGTNGTILSPRDNFFPRDKMTSGEILAITLPFFNKYDQRLKSYSRDFLPSDPGKPLCVYITYLCRIRLPSANND
jgi:hypothetical protein